jgi:hypothetical protein
MPAIVASGSVEAAADGQLEADGKGNISNAVRTLNVAGVVFHQEVSGTYTVNPDGTGSAEFTLITVDPAGIPDSTETIEFTITDQQSKLQAVGTTPGTVAKGLIVKQ